MVNVAADSGGASAILLGVHEAALATSEHRWRFVISTPELGGAEHVNIDRFPWVKRSWLHRAWFDLLVLPRLVQSAEPDVVLSLQNVPVSGVEQRQVVYLHQALPFSDFRFRFARHPKLALYQWIVSRRIFRNLSRASVVVVQSQWMKNAVTASGLLPAERVEVVPAVIPPSQGVLEYRPTAANRRRFFYPAAAYEYKNHEAILDAVEQLHAEGIRDFEVLLTINREQLPRSRRNRIPSGVRTVGHLPRDRVAEEYGRSVLLFPSLLETVGLPLLEARRANSFIIAPDLPYAREALGVYPNALFFSHGDKRSISNLMQIVMTGRPHVEVVRRVDTGGEWEKLMQILETR